MIDTKPLQRKFLPLDFQVTNWEEMQFYTDGLLSRAVNSLSDFQEFVQNHDELATVLDEDFVHRYVAKSRDTQNPEVNARYEDFVNNITPKLTLFNNQINKKFLASPYAQDMEHSGFALLLERLQTADHLFREENIPLSTDVTNLVNAVNSLRGKMTVSLDGEDVTFMVAEQRLAWNDRAKREEAWKAVAQRLDQDRQELDGLYERMFHLRQAQAKNAGFANFAEYKFLALNRNGYTVNDCFAFHKAMKENVVPLIKEMQISRKRQLGLDKLYPWDLEVDPHSRPPIKAFDGEKDFIEKTEIMLDGVDPFFGDTLRLMRDAEKLDLMSRKGKQPGAYMYGMHETNIPFVFHNATQLPGDVVTMAHELGHAVHEMAMIPLGLHAYRDYTMEVAELGSMTMEMVTRDHWQVFYKQPADLYQALREHLEDVIVMMPWIALVDEFQHRLYTQENPGIENRHALWTQLCAEYNTGEVEAHQYGHASRNFWHRQNHIFESPFYYIDYGIARLGSLQIWRNFKQDPEKALQQYKNAMALGCTKTIPEIYRTAGAQFDFSGPMVQELMQFVGAEIARLRDLEAGLAKAA